jgi:hypothetical protein
MDDFFEKVGKFLRIGFIIWISLLIILLTILFSMLVSHSCNGRSDNEQDIKVYGDFIYKVVYYNEDGIEVIEEKGIRSAIRIMGLSEEGMKKESVIIPEYIDELKVEELGKRIEFWGDEGSWQENHVLKKVYIPFDILCWSNIFEKCKELEKIIILQHNPNKYDENSGKCNFVTSFNYEVEDVVNMFIGHNGKLRFANVSYFYNYDNAPNDNYFWIDDYEYGEKIDFIPPEPTRAGYTFGGWYKESECINKWDFEIDTLPEVKYTDVIPTHQLFYNENAEYDYRIYQETKLYAKWI